MKDIIIDNENSAVKYIQNVLTKWDAFCIGHPKMTQALEMLLKIHQRKTSEVAMEVIVQMESILNKIIEQCESTGRIEGCAIAKVIQLRLSTELKKKYTESEKD